MFSLIIILGIDLDKVTPRVSLSLVYWQWVADFDPIIIAGNTHSALQKCCFIK